MRRLAVPAPKHSIPLLQQPPRCTRCPARFGQQIPVAQSGPIGQLFFSFFLPNGAAPPSVRNPSVASPTHTKRPHKAVEILSGLPFGPISPRTREAPDSALIRAALSLSHIPDGFCPAGARLTCRARSLGLLWRLDFFNHCHGRRTLRRWIIPFSVVPTLSGRLGRSIPQLHPFCFHHVCLDLGWWENLIRFWVFVLFFFFLDLLALFLPPIPPCWFSLVLYQPQFCFGLYCLSPVEGRRRDGM